MVPPYNGLQAHVKTNEENLHEMISDYLDMLLREESKVQKRIYAVLTSMPEKQDIKRYTFIWSFVQKKYRKNKSEKNVISYLQGVDGNAKNGGMGTERQHKG